MNSAPLRRAACVFVLLAVAALLAACTGREGAARDLFEQTWTCPADRIEARRVEGLTLADLRPPAHETPPAEVAADAARLALWREQQQEAQASRRRLDERYHVYDVSGCGHQARYACIFLMSERGPWRGLCEPVPEQSTKRP